MRFSKSQTDDTLLLVNEHATTASLRSLSSSLRDSPSSYQGHILRLDHAPYSIDKRSPSAEYLYTEIMKAEEKRLLERASWGSTVLHEHGLPPTGKCTDHEQIPANRNPPNRVRLRPKVARYFQPQKAYNHQVTSGRPASFNGSYDRHLIDYQQQKLANTSLNRTSSFSHQRRDPFRSPSSSSIDTIVKITTRASPSLDSSDFLSDTSAASSVTTMNTVTSLSSIIPSQISRRTSPSFDSIYSTTIRPLLNEYGQQNSSRIDYKFLSPVSQTNTFPFSSPISSPSTSFTCPKGHDQSSSSPISSSLNQYREFISQTINTDTSRDDLPSSSLPKTATPTSMTRSIMTMSMSPNRHHNQTRSAKAPITSAQMSSITNVTITTNNADGLKQQQQEDQTESTIVSNNGCLKPLTSTNNYNRMKKSVHFDRYLPEEIRSPVKISSSSNYRPTVTIASSPSALFNVNGNGDNDEQKKRCDDQHDVGTLRERERIDIAKRTSSANPLTTTANTILRSFSLSPSPLLKEGEEEEENDSRRHREEKKENVDEANCTTTRRLTTAATHLHCTTSTATVTFNDGSNNVSQKKESNSTNNSNTNLLKRPSSATVDQPMPLNSLLVKTSSLNTILSPQNPQSSPSTTTTAKKLISNGFLSLIGRSNSNNNKSSTSTEENKQLRRTSSTQLRAQRKAKQQTTQTTGPNGNQRLSADVESLLPVSSINNHHCKLSEEDIQSFDKVTTNHNIEQQSSISLHSTSTEKNTNATSSSNTDSSIPLCTNPPITNNSLSMSTTNTTTTVLPSDKGDSLNNGLLFQPVTDPKCDYVLHNHQTSKKEPFFLSPPKSLSNGDESSMMQTSTLIISTPPQYHYYLYPPINNTNTLSSSSSTSSSSTSKKNSKMISTTNRTISNVSINSVSTNSSSSYPSYESQIHDQEYPQSSQTPLNAEDETLSSSTYSIPPNRTRQKKVVQSALIDWKMKSSSETSSDSISKTKPVILSDSVQAFWPPPPSPSTLEKDSGLTTMTLTTEQTKQTDPIAISNNIISSNSLTNHSTHVNISSNKDEIGSYSEEHIFRNGCLRNASDTSLEDTQASYTERLRKKSRSIPMNGTNDLHSYLTRSLSKDALNSNHVRVNTNVQELISQEQGINPETDFQSKREFFENRTYTDNTALSSIHANILPTKPKFYTLSLSNSQMSDHRPRMTLNNHPQRNITRRSWNDLSSRQAPSSPDSSFEQIPVSHPPTIRKPVRIVKTVQRSPPSPINELTSTTRPLITSRTYLLAKPGLFSASPLNSVQRLPAKPLNSTCAFPSRDEKDLQFHLKEFALRYPQNQLLNELARSTISTEHRLSTDYTRALFPIPDRLRRIRSRQSSDGDTNSSHSSSDYTPRTVSNDSSIFDDHALRQAEDLLINLKKRLVNLKENQRIINEELENNQTLGIKLLNIIESNAEPNEIEKFKLHTSEIDTITSILVKLSSRLAKVENDLLTLSDSNEHTKASLLERREKAQQKHDEAKSLKDGIDRRSRLVTNILRKYFSNEQYEDYEHFIRMKSTLLMDGKDLEENILILDKQIELLTNLSNHAGI